jgi:outer membrane protein assembly factor BamB
MKIEDLMFIGIGGRVVALYRDSGEQVWTARIGRDFVNVSVQANKVYAAVNGEIFCLDALTGRQLWRNPLKGYGVGLVTMAFAGNSGNSTSVVAAERARQDQAAAAAAAAA